MEMTNIQKLAEEYGTVDAVNAKIKSVQSQKSRLKKQKGREDYNALMTKVIQEEQVLKEVRQYLEPKKVQVTTMTQADVDLLTYDETVRAIKSIQSKKCLIQFDPTAKTEYEEVLVIEEMLKAHREVTKEHGSDLVKKSKINDLIHHLESQDQQLDKDYVVSLLNKLLAE